MDAEARRKKIIAILSEERMPISASQIAEKLGVSRQVIVGDVALLRAVGKDILATPRGYVLENLEGRDGRITKTIACCHKLEEIREELYTILDLGGEILDVTVEHSVYGEISAPLHIFSRYDADLFISKISSSGARPLCDLTEGVHLHKILCKSDEDFERIKNALIKKGLLVV